MELFDLLCPEAKDSTFRLLLLEYGKDPWAISGWGEEGPLDQIKDLALRLFGPVGLTPSAEHPALEDMGTRAWKARRTVLLVYGVRSGRVHLHADLPNGVAWQPLQGMCKPGGNGTHDPAEES